MIDSLRYFSQRLRVLSPFVMVLMIVALVGIVYSLLSSGSEKSSHYLMPSIVVFLWAGSFYSLIKLFSNVPDKPAVDMRFFVKLGIKFKRFVYTILGVLFLVVSAVAVYVSFRLLKIWLIDG